MRSPGAPGNWSAMFLRVSTSIAPPWLAPPEGDRRGLRTGLRGPGSVRPHSSGGRGVMCTALAGDDADASVEERPVAALRYPHVAEVKRAAVDAARRKAHLYTVERSRSVSDPGLWCPGRPAADPTGVAHAPAARLLSRVRTAHRDGLLASLPSYAVRAARSSCQPANVHVAHVGCSCRERSVRMPLIKPRTRG